MIRRALITGAAGFVGPHLIEALATMDPRPQTFAWSHGPEAMPEQAVVWSAIDILDPEAVERSIREIRPDYLVHLAAISNVPRSFADPRTTWVVNVIGTLNILEAIKRAKLDTRVLLVSSSEVYGQSFARGVPLDEEAPTHPMNPYAASKLAAEVLTDPYVSHGMRLVIARPFNHIGRGQSPGFAIPSFAGQLAAIATGRQPAVISVGNLDAQRDFLHVTDVVRAYRDLLVAFDSLPVGSIFNVCSGTPRRIGDVLDALVQLSGLTVQIEQDPTRMRPSDIPIAVGDSTRLRRVTGWRPAMTWTATLDDCLRDAAARAPHSPT